MSVIAARRPHFANPRRDIAYLQLRAAPLTKAGVATQRPGTDHNRRAFPPLKPPAGLSPTGTWIVWPSGRKANRRLEYEGRRLHKTRQDGGIGVEQRAAA